MDAHPATAANGVLQLNKNCSYNLVEFGIMLCDLNSCSMGLGVQAFDSMKLFYWNL